MKLTPQQVYSDGGGSSFNAIGGIRIVALSLEGVDKASSTPQTLRTDMILNEHPLQTLHTFVLQTEETNKNIAG